MTSFAFCNMISGKIRYLIQKKKGNFEMYRHKILASAVILAEALLLALTVGHQLRNRESNHIEFSADMLSMAQETSGGLEVREGTNAITSVENGKNRRIYTPDFYLDRGIYAVSVQYQSNTPFGSSVGCRSMAVCDAEYPWIRSESLLLTSRGVSAEYFVYVRKDNTNVKIKNILEDGYFDSVSIDSITISYLNGRSTARDIIILLLIFAAVDFPLYFYLFRRESMNTWIKKNALLAAGLLALLFVAELPMTMNYLPKGYDLRFHYYRIYTIAEGIRDGMFPVKIQPEWFNGYGYATGIYYGDILLYIPAFLYLLGFSMGTAYKTYVLLMNMLTIGGSYLCFKKSTKDRYVGLFGAAVYTMAVHRLVAVCTRGALGAYTTMAFLPFVLMGIWAIYICGQGKNPMCPQNTAASDGPSACFNREEEKEYRKGWLYLVIGASGIVGSHILGSVMTVMFAVLFMLLSIKITIRKRTWIALLKAGMGCILANLFFVVPFLDTYGSMTLTTYYGNKPVYYNSAFVSQLFSTAFNAIGDVKEDLAGMHQDMPMSVGPVAGLVLFGVICFLIYNRMNEKKNDGLLVKLLILTVLSLWMSTNLFPYMWLAEYVPTVYQILKKFEFAWRFLAIASVLITVLYVMLTVKAAKVFDKKKVMAVSAVVCLLFCRQGADYIFQYNNLMKPFEYEYSFRDLSMGAVYDGLYLPEGTDYTNLPAEIKVSDAENISAEMTARKGTFVEAAVQNKTAENAWIEAPVLYYKGYHAKSSEGELAVGYGNNNRIRIQIPAGFHDSVKVAFAEPWYWRAAEIVSLVFWLWAAAYGLASRYRRGQRKNEN